MVERILGTLGARISGLHQAAYLLAFLTLGGQFFSIVRDRIFAELFGPSQTLDFYYAAFRIPDLYYAVIAGLVSSYVLLPFLVEAREKGQAAMQQLMARVTGLFMIVAACCVIPTLIWIRPILSFLFPTFAEGQNFDTFVLMTSILLLQPVILGISELIMSVVQMERRFIVYALAPIVYTLGTIVGATVLVPILGPAGLAYGVLLGAVFHAAIQFPIAKAAHLVVRPVIPPFSFSQCMARASIPRILALAIQGSVLSLLIIIAARFDTGSVTLLAFASGLCAVPIVLVGRTYAVSAFSALAELSVLHRMEEFKNVIANAARHIFLWSMLATTFFIVLRAHIVRVVFGTESFSWDDTRLTAALLAILVIPVAFQALILLMSRAYYAQEKAWTPLFVQIGAVIASVVLAFVFLYFHETHASWLSLFTQLFRIEGIADVRVASLAFGFALGQLLVGIFGLFVFHYAFGRVFAPCFRSFFHAIAASILGGFAAYTTLYALGGWFTLETFGAVLAQGILAGMVGVTVSGLTLYLVKSQELSEMITSLRKLAPTKPLPPLEP